MKILTIITLILFQLNLNTPIENYKSLLVAEFREGESGLGDFTWLVKYNFKNGAYISKDTILGVPISKKGKYGSSIRFDLGKNLIYDNRYLISGIGNVIDLKEKKIILDASDQFIKATDKTILFHRANSHGTGYSTFDLETQEYKFINNDAKPDRNHHYSPNGDYLVEVEQSKIPYQINLVDSKSKKSTFNRNCGFGTGMAIYSNTFPKVPIFWINDTNFIYANYIGNRAEIIKINTTKLEEEQVCIIDSIPEAISNAYFYLDLENNLIFNCARGDYKIDLKNKSTEQVKFYERGNNFKVEIEQDEIGSKILFKEKLIGKPWCNGYDAKTTEGLIAIEYGEPKSNLGYPKGIKTWSANTKKWTTIEIPWLCGVIGWIEN